MTTDRPLLDGITVLDLASVGPAVRASRWLADWGADVIKVGPVPRDADVHITPPAYVVDRLGIGYEALRAANPGIVLCSTSGFGQTGPRAHWAGHDLNYLAVGGYLHCSGRTADGGPALPGATVADSAGGGLHAVAAICAALTARGTTGEGTHLDVSIADGVLSLMSLAVDEYLANGTEPGPRNGLLTGRYAWYDLYQAADGGWLAVGAIEPRFFANLCRSLDCDRWTDHQYDDEAVDGMRADFAAAFAARSRDEWVDLLGPADACVTAVLDVPELLADEQFQSRGAFTEVIHPTAGPIAQVAAPLAGQVDASGLTVHDMAQPATDEVLTWAGLDAMELATLRAEGAIA